MDGELLDRKLRRERRIKLFAVVVVLILGLTVLFAVNDLLISCILAFVINYLLNPLINFLERHSISRKGATIFVFIVISIVVAGIIQLLYPIIAEQAANLKDQLPTYIKGVGKLIAETERSINRSFRNYYVIDFSQQTSEYLSTKANAIFQNLPSIISHAITTLLLSPFLAFFMLIDGRNLTRKLLALVPNSYFELALNLNHQINLQMGGFIRARLLESAIVGTFVWIGLAVLNFPYAAFLAIFAAVMNLIPYVGPVIGAIPALVIALINGYSDVLILWLAIIYLVAQILDAGVILPMALAKLVNLHPVLVVLVIIVGAQVMGILGMIISIPVASAIKLTATAIYNQVTDFKST